MDRNEVSSSLVGLSEGQKAGSQQNLKILYIAGSGRSGSTIVDRVLGQLDGFFSVGELCFLWESNIIGSRLCGCGEPVTECKFWQPVFADAFGGLDRLDTAALARQTAKAIRLHKSDVLLARSAKILTEESASFLDTQRKLYDAIRRSTSARVIVDSSKSIGYAHLLANLPNVDLYVLHLVRDPRAVSFSWKNVRQKEHEKAGTEGAAKSWINDTIVWSKRNIAARWIWNRPGRRYIFQRYEEFVSHPRQCIERILQSMDEQPQALGFLDGSFVQLQTSHSAIGDRSRFVSGKVELKQNNEWRSQMGLREKAIVTAITLPLLVQYGYFSNS